MGIFDFFKKDKERVFLSSLAVRIDGKRTKAYDEVVSLMAETLNKYGGNINKNYLDGIKELKNKGGVACTIWLVGKEFNNKNINSKEILAWNLAKKEVQSKIEGIAKYKGIHVYNKVVYCLEDDEILHLDKTIKKLDIFKDLKPDHIFLGVTFRFVTKEHDKIIDVIKELDRILKLPKVDYKDAQKRYEDGIKQITDEVYKRQSECSYEEIKKAVKYNIEVGKFKTMYDRSFIAIPLENILKWGDKYFEALYNLKNFPAQMKIESMINYGFNLMTEFEPFDEKSFFIITSDKTELDPSHLYTKLPNS